MDLSAKQGRSLAEKHKSGAVNWRVFKIIQQTSRFALAAVSLLIPINLTAPVQPRS